MTATEPSVVVGVDGSDQAVAAARAAAAEAARRNWPLRLVRAFNWGGIPLPGFPDTWAARECSRRSANTDLDRLLRDLSDCVPRWMTSSCLVEGQAASALCRAAGRDDLLVVGASGQGWGASGVLGSVAEAVAAQSGCPVLVHRPHRSGMPIARRVLVGVDGGAGSAAVLDAAADEASARGLPLVVLHAWRQLTDDDPHTLRWRLAGDQTAAVETAAVQPAVDRLRRQRPGLQVDLEIRQGRAGRVLTHAADDTDLVVVGRRDMLSGGPGSTVHAVLHRAHASVLLVPVASPVAPRTHVPSTVAAR
ncbi:universal stress protein [Klenkia sp. LSe6-5]|uniref:Universal stress protein n=1 Tax=Klenkia sesuvii TaxID=3103137 RepID=A0ABU8DU32_9ACTN